MEEEDREESRSADLCALEIRNGNDLIQELRNRYSKDNINTFVGDVLLSLNPYKKLPAIEKPTGFPEANSRHPLPANLSSVSWRAYQAMCRTRVSQCCITTGVSGSGKTESSKYLMRHVASLSAANNGFIKERLLQIDPVLEAFGNASTSLNSNSSRFCKYFEIFYNNNQRIVGGQLSHYMLETTRVTFHEQGEKNFHVFYYLLYGAEDDQLYELSLNPSVGYRFICSDLQPTIDGTLAEEAKMKFKSLVQNMTNFGLDVLDIKGVFSCLAAILHLGEIELAVTFNGSTVVTNQEAIENASFLLGISPQQLEMALLTNNGTSGESTSFKTVAEANAARDSVAEALYLRLFNFIVFKMNTSLLPRENVERKPGELVIGFLDVFGFQHLQTNRLEQFFVNMTNEQLAYFYNQYVLAWEQNEYQHEGISPARVKFVDNTKTVELLLNQKQGLLALLDKRTRSAKGDEVTLIKKFRSHHKKNPVYSSPKKSQNSVFTVQHYAGQVTYEASRFLAKNRFSFSPSIVRCLCGSQNSLIQRLFQAKISSTGSFGFPHQRDEKHDKLMMTRKRKKNKKLTGSMRRRAAVVNHVHNDSRSSSTYEMTTVGSIFRKSLAEMMEKILKSNCHFIRCIKPNQYQAPGHFDDKLILAQLQHCQVLETIFIRRSGYPVRLSFAIFVERYKILSFPLTATVKDASSSCQVILAKTKQPSDGWTIGRTKVFLKYWCVDNLNKMLNKVLRGFVVLQNMFRGCRERKRFAHIKDQQRLEKQLVGNFFTKISEQGVSVYHNLYSQNVEDNLHEYKTKHEVSEDDYGGDEVDRGPQGWCQITCYERELQRAKFTVDPTSFTIDGSQDTFEVTRIGLQSLPMRPDDSIVAKVRTAVDKGVRVFQDDELNVWAERFSQSSIFVKGHHLGQEAKEAGGKLPRMKAVMIFHYSAFVDQLESEVNQKKFNQETEERILSSTSVYISFVVDRDVDSEIPCWVELAVLDAERQAQACIVAARRKSKELQDRKPEKVQTKARSNVRFRHAAAVNALTKRIRPRTDVDSTKYGRKNWARKQVAQNPYAFGKDSSNLREQLNLKERRGTVTP